MDLLDIMGGASWIVSCCSEKRPTVDSASVAGGGCLAFKGGTALKKCYFGDYRFSEDTDFSGLEDTPTGADLEYLISHVCETASKLLED